MPPRVFISYVKENVRTVSRLAKELERNGIAVWYDRDSLLPGQRWAQKIAAAIARGDFFIACFSEAYASRSITYMNEELIIAIEQLRLRPAERTWFIPVLIDRCEIPDRDVGAGASLRDIHAARLYENWTAGIALLVSVIYARADRPPPLADSPPARSEHTSTPPREVKRSTSIPLADAHSRVMELEERCFAYRRQLDSAQQEQATLPTSALGWPLEIVAALVFTATILGWYPALRALTLQHDPYFVLLAVAAMFSVGGTVIAVFIGEMLRRRGERTADSFVDAALLAAAATLVLGNFFIIYSSIHAYEQFRSTLPTSMPAIASSAMTILSVLGTVIAIIATYHRESVKARRLSRQIRRFRDDVARAEARLWDARRSLGATGDNS